MFGFTSPKRIFISSIVIFIILSAIFWQWGNIGDFIGDNQFDIHNHFGLSKPSDDGKIIVNHWILGPLAWSLAWALLIVIWKKDITTELKLIFSILLTCIIGYWLYSPGRDIAWALSKILLWSPVVWLIFWIVMLIVLSNYDGLWWDKELVIPTTIFFIFMGSLTHGWFGGFTNHLLLGLLSGALHLLGLLSWALCLSVLLAIGVLVVLSTIALSLAIAGTLIVSFLAILVIFIILFLLFIVMSLDGYAPNEIWHQIDDMRDEISG